MSEDRTTHHTGSHQAPATLLDSIADADARGCALVTVIGGRLAILLQTGPTVDDDSERIAAVSQALATAGIEVL